MYCYEGNLQMWVMPTINCPYIKEIIFFYLSACRHAKSFHLFVTLWTVSYQAPLSWDSPGKNTGVCCHALLQKIFSNEESNLHLLCLLHWQEDSLPWNHWGTPFIQEVSSNQWKALRAKPRKSASNTTVSAPA